MGDNNNGEFDVRPKWIGKLAVLSVYGDLDILTAPALNEAIVAVLPDSPEAVIVNLDGVGFLASAGMSALIRAHQQVTPTAPFIVVADGPATSRPLKLVGVDAIVTLYPTLERAIEACEHR